MAPRISVIIPTLGRPHLARTLRSVVEQYPYQIVVVGDPAGNMDHAQRVCDYFGVPLEIVPADEHKQGYAQRTHGMSLAQGTHLAFLDDDDAWTPGAHTAMKERAADVPVVFRMAHPELGVLWRTPKVMFSNVGTPMFLIPNRPKDLGSWRPYLSRLDNRVTGGGDFLFLLETADRMGGLMWDDRVVCSVRPN